VWGLGFRIKGDTASMAVDQRIPRFIRAESGRDELAGGHRGVFAPARHNLRSRGLGFGLWIWGLGFGVWGLKFGVEGLGFRV